MSISIMLLGVLIGMRHAFEADHVAAVATLTTRSHSLSSALRQGVVWGVGHTLTLVLIGTAVLFMDTYIPDNFARSLEMIVGIMLVALGADVLAFMYRERIHIHAHRHNDGIVHVHAHSHRNARKHNPHSHDHEHPAGFPMRALFVGLMHGLAGSAALILLTLQTVESPLLGMFYILLFGTGSIIGMALLSIIIAVPLHYSARGLTRVHNGLQVMVACISLAVGFTVIYHTGFAQGGLLV